MCEKECYAKRIEVRRPSVRKHYEANLAATRRPDFVEKMIAEFVLFEPKVVRIHVSGDFVSAGYAHKWLAIMRANPKTRFYFYSRSWRSPRIKMVLDRMCGLKNVSGWFSADKESGLPPAGPAKATKTAKTVWLQTEDDDLPPPCDLAFRVHKIRKRPGKKVKDTEGSSVLVCPAESGGVKVSCDKCGICWKPQAADSRRPNALALTVIAR